MICDFNEVSTFRGNVVVKVTRSFGFWCHGGTPDSVMFVKSQ